MGRPTSNKEFKRIQMDMPERSVARLKALQEMTDATSYAEVIKNALRLYESMLLEVSNGGEVLIRRGDTFEKISVFSA